MHPLQERVDPDSPDDKRTKVADEDVDNFLNHMGNLKEATDSGMVQCLHRNSELFLHV